jgi:8-oxo-dGTP pyrophosphatase MutT (NUDIX family)
MNVRTLNARDRHAAVSTILRDGERGAEVLLIRRAEHGDDPWSGHMAFPGGRHEPTDPSLLDTAVRETREEVGIDLGRDAELLARLAEIPAIARGKRVGLTVTPFVFALTHDAPLQLNHEVAEAIWAPLEHFTAAESATTVSYALDGTTLSLPGWTVEGRIVWGLTYRMLEQLLDAVR